MPGRNGMGPVGLGPMTGRGLGMCVAGVNALRYGTRAGRGLRTTLGVGLGPGLARGLGLGLGRGLVRGLGCGMVLGIGYGCMRVLRSHLAVNQTEVSEEELLHEQKNMLERRLDMINQQLENVGESDK